MAGIGGFEPPKLRSQSPLSYRLTISQNKKQFFFEGKFILGSGELVGKTVKNDLVLVMGLEPIRY